MTAQVKQQVAPLGRRDETILIRSKKMLSLDEALARSRMRDAASGRHRRGARRPALQVVMALARRRDRH
jgi:hypothetical protein